MDVDKDGRLMPSELLEALRDKLPEAEVRRGGRGREGGKNRREIGGQGRAGGCFAMCALVVVVVVVAGLCMV